MNQSQLTRQATSSKSKYSELEHYFLLSNIYISIRNIHIPCMNIHIPIVNIHNPTSFKFNIQYSASTLDTNFQCVTIYFYVCAEWKQLQIERLVNLEKKIIVCICKEYASISFCKLIIRISLHTSTQIRPRALWCY